MNKNIILIFGCIFNKKYFFRKPIVYPEMKYNYLKFIKRQVYYNGKKFTLLKEMYKQ